MVVGRVATREQLLVGGRVGEPRPLPLCLPESLTLYMEVCVCVPVEGKTSTPRDLSSGAMQLAFQTRSLLGLGAWPLS